MTIHHVLIGAGPAATNAIETIRRLESEPSRVTLICDEPPHSRMALPYWLSGSIPREQTLTADESYLGRLGAEARLGVRVDRVDPERRTLSLSDDTSVTFDKLLIATGSAPQRPPIEGIDLPGVQTCWTLADVESVLQQTSGLAEPRVAMVGAGFVGMIMLGAMLKRKWQLTIVEQEAHILPRMLDQGAASIAQSWLSSRGVQLHLATTVESIRGDHTEKRLRLSDGQEVTADLVVLATGVRPNLDLTEGTGIATEVGILVDDQMRTTVEHVFAAGDVAQGPVLLSDDRAVHAIQPTAVDHGRVAGANMAGTVVHYPGSLSMNVLEMSGLQCASYGLLGGSDTDEVTIANPKQSIYRKLMWRNDVLVGAIFAGKAQDAGMLTDVGMVKGMLQTGTPFGIWKQYLLENPFDLRRPFVALGIPSKLARTTLLGRPTDQRGFRFNAPTLDVPANEHHKVFLKTRQD